MPLFQLETDFLSAFPAGIASALTPGSTAQTVRKNSDVAMNLQSTTNLAAGKFQPASHIIEFSRKSSQATANTGMAAVKGTGVVI